MINVGGGRGGGGAGVFLGVGDCQVGEQVGVMVGGVLVALVLR